MKQGWEIKKLGDVCCKKQQIARATKKYTPSDNIAYIDISAIDSVTNEITEPTILRFQDAPSRAQQVVEKDDILISLVRPNLKNIAQVNDSREDLVASSGFCVLRTKENPRYIRYVVLGERFTNYLISRTSGANYPAVREEDIKEYPIPIPPLPEQEKIVSELDCLSVLIDKKRQQLKELDALAQSIFYEMFGNPVENERGWEVKKLGEVTNSVNYGTSFPANEGGAFTYLRMNNLTYNGYIDLNDTKKIDVPEKDLEKYIVRKGDVLFNRTNSKELVGKTALFNLDEEMVIAGYIIRVRVNKKFVQPIYVVRYMNTPFMKSYFRGLCKGAVNQANINSKELNAIPIPLPPLPLQQIFAQKVEAIEKQKELIKQSITEAETLLASRMQYYFE